MWKHKGVTYASREDLPESLLESWDHHGVQFGYPTCCIKAFRKGEQIRESVFSGTGFLPCKICSRKDPREVLRQIDSNRIVETKFPFHDGKDLLSKSRVIRYHFIQGMRESYEVLPWHE